MKNTEGRSKRIRFVSDGDHSVSGVERMRLESGRPMGTLLLPKKMDVSIGVKNMVSTIA